MRFRLLALATLFAMTGVVTSASGQGFKLGPHAGIADFEEFYIGGNVTFPLGLQLGEGTLDLNGNLNYYFIDGATWFTIDGNLVYPFAMDGPFFPYAGAGLVISFFSYDGPDLDDFDFDDLFSKRAAEAKEVATQASETDFGLNIFGGAEYGVGKMVPFGTVGYYLKDGGFLYIQGGLRFLLGGG